MADKPDFVGPCSRCGRPVRNPHFIGSLLVGRECRKKMLTDGFNEIVRRCPVCHQNLPDDRKLTVRDDQVVLEPTVKSLDEFSEARSKFVPPPTGATFKLLSVEVIHADGSVTPLTIRQDEKREGNGDDGKTADSGTDEGRRRNGAENVDGARGSEGKTESAEEVHRKRSDSSEPSEDA